MELQGIMGALIHPKMNSKHSIFKGSANTCPLGVKSLTTMSPLSHQVREQQRTKRKYSYSTLLGPGQAKHKAVKRQTMLPSTQQSMSTEHHQLEIPHTGNELTCVGCSYAELAGKVTINNL